MARLEKKIQKLEKDIQKSVELFERVVRLNQKAIKAESNIVYNFDYSCGCNGISFTIMDRTEGGYTQINDGDSHYFGETYGKPLEEIEKEIAEEEKKYA